MKEDGKVLVVNREAQTIPIPREKNIFDNLFRKIQVVNSSVLFVAPYKTAMYENEQMTIITFKGNQLLHFNENSLTTKCVEIIHIMIF